MITRIILGLTTIICFFLFFYYDSFELVREERNMVVEAKASSINKGKLVGAFLIYREVKDNVVSGEPVTMLVDKEQYDNTKLGTSKIEFVRGQVAYILFIIGIVALFFLFMSISPDFVELLIDMFIF